MIITTQWDDRYQNVDGNLKWKVTSEQLQPYSDNTHISICNFTEIKGGLVAG